MRIHKEILVIDVETTGLDPAKHACIELGAVCLDKDLQMTKQFSSLVAPWKGAEFVKEAMKINQIAAEQLRGAPSIEDVVEAFHETFRPDEKILLLSGWNVWLDAYFLRNLYERASREWPFNYRLLDVQSVFSFHSLMAASSQEKTIQELLHEKQEHRALADAKHTSRVLQLLSKQFLTESNVINFSQDTT
jgi:DNA polymerase III epsilon subunit-like protein